MSLMQNGCRVAIDMRVYTEAYALFIQKYALIESIIQIMITWCRAVYAVEQT